MLAAIVECGQKMLARRLDTILELAAVRRLTNPTESVELPFWNPKTREPVPLHADQAELFYRDETAGTEIMRLALYWPENVAAAWLLLLNTAWLSGSEPCSLAHYVCKVPKAHSLTTTVSSSIQNELQLSFGQPNVETSAGSAQPR